MLNNRYPPTDQQIQLAKGHVISDSSLLASRAGKNRPEFIVMDDVEDDHSTSGCRVGEHHATMKGIEK